MSIIIPKRTERFLLLANILMIIVVIADLFYLTGMFKTDLPMFTLINLIVLGIGLLSFRIKRDIKDRIRKRNSTT